MNKVLRTLLYAAATLGLLVFLMWLSPYRYLIKGIELTYLRGQTTSHYLDWKDFDTREIANDPKAIRPFDLAEDRFEQPISEELQTMLESTNSGSYLVVLRDTLVMERYFDPFGEEEKANSFSMAKTITAMLVQIAIQQGKIPSWDEPVRTYLPWVGELAGQKNPEYEAHAKALTLRHLITMTAGLEWNESYTAPMGITARAYYGSDIEATMREVAVVRQPGTHYEYQSGATQLVGLALSQALGESLSAFASRELWSKIGAEAPALWQLDRENGKELNYCCFDARSRDFAKLGRLVLHHGEGLVDSAFLAMAQIPLDEIKLPGLGGEMTHKYGHSFWLFDLEEGGKTYKLSCFQGHLGQFVICIPELDMIVVRNGNGFQRDPGNMHACAQLYTREAIRRFAGR